jgi:hypothetical protein
MVMTIDCRSRSSKPWQVPKKCQPQGLPDRKAGNSSACARPAHPGRGHRPCHSVPLPPGQPGAQSPRPAPAPPQAGASRPPGRALASCCAWTCRSTGHRPARAGKRRAFPVPARSGADRQTPNHQPRCHGRGHRPCHSARLTPGPPGAQSPRPAPAPPPAGASRPPGRALACRCAWTCRSTGHRPARAGKRSAFRGPARTDESPFTAAMAGAIAPATAPD